MAKPSAQKRRVLLIGCVKSKTPGRHRAKDLYVSTLFRRRRGFAEAMPVPWFILSAKHGLVRPDEELEAYDEALSSYSRADREAWGERVARALLAEIGDLSGTAFEIHAGVRYVSAIEPALVAHGATVDVPVRGLRLGQQLARYRTSFGLTAGRTVET